MALLDAFNNKHKLRAFLNSITARQGLPGENIKVHLSDLTSLVSQAFPDYTPEQKTSEIFRRFLTGLDPILKSKCVERVTQNVEEAVEYCKNYERAQYELNPASMTTQVGTMSLHNPPTNSMPVPAHMVANLDSHDSNITADRVQALDSFIEEIRKERKSNEPVERLFIIQWRMFGRELNCPTL